MKYNTIKKSYQFVLSFIFLILFAYCEPTFAASSAKALGSIAGNITSAMANLAKLITATSYVAGFGFAAAGILKFKAHKDNPTQIPLGAPVALLFVGAALIFLPTIFGVAGETLFASTSGTGGVAGISSFS